MQTLEDLEAEKERLEREIEQKQASDLDWSAIRNRTSNDAMLNEDLKDDRGTKTSELNASAKDIMAGMNANRALTKRDWPRRSRFSTPIAEATKAKPPTGRIRR